MSAKASESTSRVVDAGIEGGPLKRRIYGGARESNTDLFLEYCPVCGPEESFEGQKKISWHIATHDPEDFGLPPLQNPVLEDEECTELHVECTHCDMESREGFVVPSEDCEDRDDDHEWVEVTVHG